MVGKRFDAMDFLRSLASLFSWDYWIAGIAACLEEVTVRERGIVLLCL